MGPGVELVKKEFEDLLPAISEIKFPKQTTNMDLIQMALAQFKGNKLSQFTKNGEKFDFDTFTASQYHIVKVRGLQKDKAIMDMLSSALQPYVINQIKAATELPTEFCSSKCHDSLKGPFKIIAAI